MEIINKIVVKTPKGGKKVKVPEPTITYGCSSAAFIPVHTKEGGCTRFWPTTDLPCHHLR